MITRKEIAEALYLSCVESYFLAWLNRFYDVKKLYGGSFIPLGKVFDDFSRGAMYQNYCDIPRLQDVAEEYGVITHKYVKCCAGEAIDLLKNQEEGGLCLIRVNTSFFTDFKRSSWREDHYVCVDKNLNWINQYPLSEGTFDEKRFSEVYDGAVLVYALGDLTQTPPRSDVTGFVTQDFNADNLPRELGALESAIGVLRVSRKRLEKLFSENETVQKLLREEITETDKIYFEAHLRRLKEKNKEKTNKAKAQAALCEKIYKIIKIEKKISEELKNGKID